MNIEEVTNKLIADDFKNEVVISVSGNFHKVTDTQTIGKYTVLNVEGSIKVIRREALAYYYKLEKGGSLLEENKETLDLPFTVVIEAIKMLLKGQRSILFRIWQYDIEALKELCFALGYTDDTLDC